MIESGKLKDIVTGYLPKFIKDLEKNLNIKD